MYSHKAQWPWLSRARGVLPLQVPGEMFALAMEAKKRDMGVVGSTQNILDFIAAKVQDAVARPFPDTLQVTHS